MSRRREHLPVVSSTARPVPPPMFGYVRADLAERTDHVAEWDRTIKAFADRDGFALHAVIHDDAGRTGFERLLDELRQAECHHVVVPTMGHVYCAGPRRHALVSRLWHEGGAGLWTADTASAVSISGNKYADIDTDASRS